MNEIGNLEYGLSDMKISNDLLEIISNGEPSMETYKMINGYELTNIDINGILHDINYYEYNKYGIPPRISQILNNLFNNNWTIMKGINGIYIFNNIDIYITSTPTELILTTIRGNTMTLSNVIRMELRELSLEYRELHDYLENIIY
jgi:hypothetical protein